MKKIIKYSTAFLLTLLVSAALLLATSPTLNAQDDVIIPPPIPNFPREIPELEAGVVIVASVGGTTNPPYGEYTFPNQTRFELRAIPNEGFRFSHWVISGENLPGHLPPIFVPTEASEDWVPDIPTSLRKAAVDSLVSSQNPLNVICGYGNIYQYQPVFIPVSTEGTPVSGTVIILAAVGGSVSPNPGTYTYENDALVTLTATPDSGFVFDHWVISGSSLTGHGDIENGTRPENPLITHAVNGETYNYQPVFSPVGSATPVGVAVEYLYAVIIVLVVIAVIGISAAAVYRRRSK